MFGKTAILCFIPKTELLSDTVRFLYCAEAIDNGDDVDFTISKSDKLVRTGEGVITGKTTDGSVFRLIPYYKWNNRGNCKMRIWLRQEGMARENETLDGWEKKLYRPWRIDN